MVKIGEGWLEQKLLSLKAGLRNESNILQDNHFGPIFVETFWSIYKECSDHLEICTLSYNFEKNAKKINKIEDFFRKMNSFYRRFASL